MWQRICNFLYLPILPWHSWDRNHSPFSVAMPEDTRKSRSSVVSMFDLVPRDATEGTDRKLCLRTAGGCVTSALPRTVATWQPTTGCGTFLIGSSPGNRPGVPDNWEVGLRVTAKHPGLWPLRCSLVLVCDGYLLFRILRCGWVCHVQLL